MALANARDSNVLMKSSMNAPEPGEIVAGKYVVERTLGEGGMGFVLAATHRHLDQRVAIKCLLPELADDPEIVARFLREGQAATKIRSEHVVRVLDVGTLDSGAPFLVMEYLDGRDLSQLLEAAGPLPVQRAVDYVLQALEAIAEAHALGMVHRDLKPANLFESHRADGTPVIKVLDFGISKVTTPGGMNPSMTRTQTTMGSPQYMSPEQMRSTRDVDARADIWAFGIVLFELVAGAPVFKGQSMAELCAQILQDPASSVVELRADAPSAFDRVIQRCLEKDPKHRYANVGELALALAEFASSEGRASAARVVRVLEAHGGAPSQGVIAISAAPQARTSTSWSGLGRTGKRKPNVLIPAVAIVGALGAVGASWLWLKRSASTPSQGATSADAAVQSAASAPVSTAAEPDASLAPAPSVPDAPTVGPALPTASASVAPPASPKRPVSVSSAGHAPATAPSAHLFNSRY
jgi:eukaryotic-like serine/threonine-protein kinase